MNRDGEERSNPRLPSRPAARPLLSTEPNRRYDDEPTVGLFDPDAPVRSVPGPGSGRPGSGSTAARGRNRLGTGVLGSGPETARPITRPVPTVHLGSPTLPPSDPATTGNFPPGSLGALNEGPDPLPVPVFERVVDGVYRLRTLLGLVLAAVITVAVVVAYRSPTGESDDVVAGAASGAESRSALVANADQTTTTVSTLTSGETDVESVVDSITNPDGSDSTPAGPQSSTPTTVPASDSTAATDTTLDATTTSDASGTSSTDTTIDGSSSTTETTAATSTTVPGSTSSTVDPSTTTTTDPGSTSTSTTSTTVAPPMTVEAETGTMLGTARVRTDHLNYTGAGFVGDIINEGSGVAFTVTAVGGHTPFTVRYSAGPDNGPAGTRTIGVLVNGTRITEAQMRLTASWDDWDIVTGTIPLDPGENTITLIQEAGDTGWVNIDSVQLY